MYALRELLVVPREDQVKWSLPLDSYEEYTGSGQLKCTQGITDERKHGEWASYARFLRFRD